MQHVTKEGIERIRSANSLVEIVKERGIELRPKGRSHFALCPFHEEKTPSFSVTPHRGLFQCFGCGVSGDVIGFVVRHDQIAFPAALEKLAGRAGMKLDALMEAPAIGTSGVRANGNGRGTGHSSSRPVQPGLLGRVVEHYHRTFCQHEEAQTFLAERGITDNALLKALKVGYADGSLLTLTAKGSDVRTQLEQLGVITATGRELFGGCLVVPIPDPITGEWTSLYGRGRRTKRHCYLPGPMRGVVNYQAARLSSEVILTESILDAVSMHQAGISTAIPIYGVNGFTADHLDLLKREGVSRVILALDNDGPGKKATETIRKRLEKVGVDVGIAEFPNGIKDANALLLSRNGDAGETFRRMLDAAGPQRVVVTPPPSSETASQASAESSLLSEKHTAPTKAPEVTRADDTLVLTRQGITYQVKAYPVTLGRLRATVKAERGPSFHVDTLDLYASRSRTEFSKRAAKALGVGVDDIEQALLAILVEAEKCIEEDEGKPDVSAVPKLSDSEKRKALAFLKRPDLLEQIRRDIATLGFVGEETNKLLLYLVAVSRKLADPLSAVILSQSGAGKSGITEVIERLIPPEDVVLVTRLTPQSLYYIEDGFLDQKLVIVEERQGSVEADYSIRVLQSRKKLIAAAPVKDPQTGTMKTKIFTVEARAAFIEATTASSVNHENATRCFELSMDESVAQTQRIHERQRLMKTERGLRLREEAAQIAQLHWNAQRLLESTPVVIPFADLLTFPASWMRTRRDHARFLNLIEVSAFLHQHQRERRNGAICASVADYAVAYELSRDVLAETLSDVRKPLRDAFRSIQELSLKRDGTVSRREVREALNLPDSTVRRWLADLVELEYLSVAEGSRGGAGRSTRYHVATQAPQLEEGAGLLTPSGLEAML
jgi:DNA primase catalytic core